MISEYTNETDQGSFFGAAIDIALIATAIISSLSTPSSTQYP